MPTYTRTQTVLAVQWTDDLSDQDVVGWVHRHGGRAVSWLLEEKVSVGSWLLEEKVSVGADARRGDWVVEVPRPAGSDPADITPFTVLDAETFARQGWEMER